MTRAWRRTLAVLAACSLVAVAASCGDDGGSASPNTTGEQAASSDAPSTTEPVVGGDATLLISNEIASLDPVSAIGSTLDSQRMFAVYGALITYRPDTAEAVPVLAESFEPSADYSTWTLTLRPNLVFSDGSAFNADAIRVNIERAKDPANRSPGLGVASEIQTITVANPTTLELALVAPNSAFPSALSRSSLNYIASAEAIAAGHDFTSTPIGAGPFLLSEWIRDDHMTFTRNPDWFDQPRPYVDSLTFRMVPDEAQRIDTFLTGDADIVYTQVPEGIERAMAQEDGLRTVGEVQADGRTLSFNTASAPLNDPRVRLAIALGVDRQVVVDVGNPGAEPAENFAVPGTRWHVEEGTLPAFDADAAQALINEVVAETGGPVRLKVISGQSPFIHQVAKVVQTSMSQLENVEVEVEVADTATFVGKVRAGDYQIAVWGYPWVDPEPSLYSAIRGGLPTNYSKYANTAVDTALDKARVAADIDDRVELYTTVFEALATDLPFLPLFHSENFYLHRDVLHGLEDSLYDEGNLRTDLMWFSQ